MVLSLRPAMSPAALPYSSPTNPTRARESSAGNGGRRRNHGLTLPELLGAMAIAAILAGIAMPMVSGTLHAARAADARTSLLRTYQSAIRHASVAGVHVVACPSTTDNGCRDSIDWSSGWLLFEDRDGDRQHNESELVLASFPPLAERVHLRSTAGRKRLVFQPSGGNAGSNVTLTLCDGRGADKAVQMVMANDGRLRESKAPSPSANDCVLPMN
jgi:type IV fimbrial biogenesis protein FimT